MTRPPQGPPPAPDPIKLVEALLMERMADITAALPPLLKKQAGDFVRLALVDLPRQRKLLDVARAAPHRVLVALMDIARMGLVPGSKIGEAYVVPFDRSEKQVNGWVKVPDCQAILGYRGLIKLARRSGEIADIRARVVCEGDDFTLEFGTQERLVHRPQPHIDRSEWDAMLGIYCIADFKGGGQHVEWMSRSEIWEIAKRSATWSTRDQRHLSGPWTTDAVEMAKKTVARRASKWWPLTVDAAEAIGRDEEREIVVEAEDRSTLALPSAAGGVRIFDAGRFADPEPAEREPEPQSQPQPQPQQQAASAPAPHAWETQPPDKARRAPQQQAAPQRKQASPPAAQQQGSPPPISPEEAAEILRREQEEAAAAERGVGD